jgi:hypothetical protein
MWGIHVGKFSVLIEKLRLKSCSIFTKNIKVCELRCDKMLGQIMIRILNTHPEIAIEWESKEEEYSFDKMVQQQLSLDKFKELFSGLWQNTYSFPNGQKGKETFTLETFDGQPAFKTKEGDILLISDVEFISDNELSFTLVQSFGLFFKSLIKACRNSKKSSFDFTF